MRCFSCHTFQVQQKTKSAKFKCKLCGMKQSLVRVYSHSTKAKDVRLRVQELNMMRGELERSKQDRMVVRAAGEDFGGVVDYGGVEVEGSGVLGSTWNVVSRSRV